MKKAMLAAVAAFALTALVMTGGTGCQKETCYECTKANPGGPDAKWDMCDEATHDRAVQSGYNCVKQ